MKENLSQRNLSQRKKPLILLSSGEKTIPCNVDDVQACEAYKFATFQVASNFNALESISPEQSLESKERYVTSYIFDRTQGPAASVHAGGAAIARAYTPFIPPTNNHFPNSSLLNMIPNELSQFFPVQNGYVDFQQCPNDLPPFDSEKLLPLANVVYQSNVQVTSKSESHNTMQVPPRLMENPHYIDQVFCAAVNLAQGLSGRLNKRSPNAIERASLMLDASYQGTYLSCALNKRNRLVLTLIGGGVFGNQMSDILYSLGKAHLMYGHLIEDEVALLVY
eukprot:CAMPEP_0201556186 /NCGR_PEP_ID=MMETSP0173_2-20130828/53822_1 /ASSEMBLY_ACC=CAM_ASM_000268 /TAXON_ID=218659 /ORGANISM="Vexillifera sp., Strain DIVA3 564/2" /LENGTH=278 /DNA_ID=CAMNT_0047968331 /DNA_START=234 /DNA_END=1067 /DNA_ORIENTATION=-